MPLRRADDAYDPSDRFSGVLFAMTDGKSRIVYRVTYEALQDRGSADSRGQVHDPVETFLRHRERIEQIASDKYDAGVAERVVTTAELTPYPPAPTISIPPGTVPVGGAAPTDISFLSGAGFDVDAAAIEEARRRRSAAAIASGATEIPLPPQSHTGAEPSAQDEPPPTPRVDELEASSLMAGSGSMEANATLEKPPPHVPDQTFAPVRIEERDGKIARASDRDSALQSTEEDFNAWHEPIIEHVRELLEGDFRQGTNHSRARDRLLALETLLSGNLSEVKDRQFRIGYEIERLGGLISAYRSSSDDMPALNAAVLEDLERLYLALKIGIDKLERLQLSACLGGGVFVLRGLRGSDGLAGNGHFLHDRFDRLQLCSKRRRAPYRPGLRGERRWRRRRCRRRRGDIVTSVGPTSP